MTKETTNNKIYHYTDANGLLGIIKSKKIWATDARFLNDSMEIEAGIKSYEILIDEYIKTINTNKVNSEQYLLEFYTKIKSMLRRNLENGKVYITSFSKSRDNLRQWMAYCPPNAGYAIAFNRKSITQNNNSFLGKRLIEVSYEKIENSELEPSRIIQSIFNNEDRNAFANKGLQTVNDILFNCTSLKNKEFHDENEVRLSIISIENEPEKIKFRNKSGIIIPYQEHEIDTSSIEEIIIGPNINKDTAFKGLSKLIKNEELNIEIKHSDCSLRVF